MYTVTRTRGDRRYLYQQESYRNAEGKPRTKYKYLGPVDGGVRKKRRLGELLSGIVEMARSTKPWEDEELAEARFEQQRRDWEKTQYINHLITHPMTIEQLKEVADYQRAQSVEARQAKESFYISRPEFVEPISDPDPVAAAPEPASDGAGEPPPDAPAAEAAPEPPEPSECDTPPSEPSQPSDQTPTAAPE